MMIGRFLPYVRCKPCSTGSAVGGTVCRRRAAGVVLGLGLSHVSPPFVQVLGGRGADDSNSGGSGSGTAVYSGELADACEGLGLTRFQAELMPGSSALFISRLQVGSPS